MKCVSYWRDTATALADDHTGPVEGHHDVAVIGGSFTGLGAGLQLAKAAPWSS
ncbi:putative oxidoreductase with FAD/NAD(P)-binding domain (fragment) [Bradyrhizobium sp. ORS 375]